jgi:hypothetical protein
VILSRFFSPKWQSNYPATRVKGLRRLSDVGVLNDLAANDPVSGVRDAARQRLRDVRYEAIKHLFFAASDLPGTDSQVARAMPGTPAYLRVQRNVALIDSDKLLAKLAQGAATSTVRQLAIERCTDRDVLNEIVRNNGDGYGVVTTAPSRADSPPFSQGLP